MTPFAVASPHCHAKRGFYCWPRRSTARNVRRLTKLVGDRAKRVGNRFRALRDSTRSFALRLKNGFFDFVNVMKRATVAAHSFVPIRVIRGKTLSCESFGNHYRAIRCATAPAPDALKMTVSSERFREFGNAALCSVAYGAFRKNFLGAKPVELSSTALTLSPAYCINRGHEIRGLPFLN